MTAQDELALVDKSKHILQLRDKRLQLSENYDIITHQNYKFYHFSTFLTFLKSGWKLVAIMKLAYLSYQLKIKTLQYTPYRNNPLTAQENKLY